MHSPMASVAHCTASVMQAMWMRAWPSVETMMAGWNSDRRGLSGGEEYGEQGVRNTMKAGIEMFVRVDTDEQSSSQTIV